MLTLECRKCRRWYAVDVGDIEGNPPYCCRCLLASDIIIGPLLGTKRFDKSLSSLHFEALCELENAEPYDSLEPWEDISPGSAD